MIKFLNLMTYLLILCLGSLVIACPYEVGGHTKGLAFGMDIPEDSWHNFVKESKDVVDAAKYNEIIDKIVAVYRPVIESMGAKLKVHKDWENGEVNAFAHRTGNTWHVTLMGGLARHKDQTPDGYAHTVCHEFGHHLAGYPTYPGRWASSEGQSNYFATSKCMRAVFGEEDNSLAVGDLVFDIDNPIEKACADVYQLDDQAYFTCMRSVVGAVADNNVMATLGREGEISVITPSRNTVKRHFNRHPKAQCQLDTSFQGALCAKASVTLVGTANYAEGYCSREAGDVVGMRPLCWFSPKQAQGDSFAAWF